ncbi:hypothetical protein MNBD_GAMMA26-396 [hydrothermal vent metagenome]|uniref:SPOR domain-containing protein n=1 Tax=hydrothermal vent metagenome TaxID=652676 RepID=A0A3B1ALN4_9ZZZZ
MKRLFLLLLAINLGLFLWGYQQEQHSLRIAPAPRANVGDLYLLSELGSNPELVTNTAGAAVLEAEQSYLPEQEESIADATNEYIAEHDEPIIAMPAPVIEPEPAAAAHEETGETIVAMTVPAIDEEHIGALTEEGIELPVAETERPPLDEVQEEDILEEQLVFESEEIAEVTMPENIPQTEIEAGPEEFTMEHKCYKLGPIDKRFVATEIARQLTNLNVEVTSHEVPVRRHIGYWVVYPPLDTIAQTRKKMQELKAAGVTDVWRFPQGEFRNAISLGLFSQMKNAEGIRESTLEKGFVTQVLSRYEEGVQYWLEFKSADTPPLSEENLQMLQDGHTDPDMELHPCSAVVIP